MAFSTLTFLILFLPTVILSYFAVGLIGRLISHTSLGNKDSLVNPLLPLQNIVMLIASLIFYAWGEPVHVLLLISASLLAWMGGIGMRWAMKNQRKRLELTFMSVTIALLIASLLVFKYLGFLTENLNSIPCFHLPAVDIKLPIGISFYTFQILSYIIDLHRDRIDVQRNPLRFMLYVSLFPQLIAGPIVRYQTIETELSTRRFNADDIKEGTYRFISGLAKKVLIADNVARLSDAIYKVYAESGMYNPTAYDSVGTTALWLASFAYTMQIFFDFSGYSDMAIGLGRIFGFHFPENFNYPYVSHSLSEFWRRWHISLSSWFRDYVYFPLGGSRCSKSRRTFNILFVWMLTGLWHGAAWNFVFWGLLNGIILMIEKIIFDHTGKKNFSGFWGWLYTFVVVDVCWVLFRHDNSYELKRALSRMFNWHSTDWMRLLAENSDILLTLGFLPLAFFLCFPVFEKYMSKKGIGMELTRTLVAFLLLLLCFMYIISSSFHPFIYFRF